MKDGNEIKRIIFLVISVLLVWTVIILRIIQIQLIDRGKYVEIAKGQYIHEMKLLSDRGSIYDRHANILAVNKPALSFGIDVKKVDDPEYVASRFADILGGNKTYYLRQLTNGNPFVWLKRGVEDDIIHSLDSLKISGIRVIRENKRYYPQNGLAANLVGFTDVDLKGLSGVELTMDESLKGNHGIAIYQKDALGKTFADVTHPVKKPESGKSVILTIDNTFQLFAEEELAYTVNQYDADGGIVIVIDPYTGEILAMAVSPSFDPNKPGRFPPNTWRNRTITDTFEPGSTFKPFFMSAIIEEGIKKPEDIIYCENGKYKIYDREIDDVSGYGWLTLDNIIAKSSNIGMAKLAQEVKTDIIYQYIREFGFGVKTGIELSGEVPGDLKNTIEWTRSTPISMAMGYEVSVTALQLAMAYGAIANGGYLLKPKIFIDDPQRELRLSRVERGKIMRRVISEQTSRIIKSMLENVVEIGTGQRAAVPGLRIAGKTGTARKYSVKKQAYSTEEFFASFIGFFPVDEPRILMCVMIDNPQKEYFGGVVAATTFKRIFQKMIRSMEIESECVIKPAIEVVETNNEEKVRIPDLISKKLETAKMILQGLNLDYSCQNSGELIVKQEPVPGKEVNPHSVVSLTLQEIKNNNGRYTRVPKVVGLTIRDALNRLELEKINVVVQGSGRVVKQVPVPGEKIRVGARCVIQCQPSQDITEFKSW